MNGKRFFLVEGWLLMGAACGVVVMGVIIALGTGNSLQGVMPLIYGFGGQGLGDLIAGLLRPIFTSLSWLIGIGGVVFGGMIFVLGRVILHYRSLLLRVEALENGGE
ncbi:MAG: hypothetical protein DWQ04_06120 [Chloroflexi bacterium]|nr:MAG: hypothetical protein DWQ04_06120 [Chloroflexota bacterium]